MLVSIDFGSTLSGSTVVTVPIYGAFSLAVAVTVNFSPAFFAVLLADTSKYFNTVSAFHIAPLFPGVVSPFTFVRAAAVVFDVNLTALLLGSVFLSALV